MMRWKFNTLRGQLKDLDSKAAEYRSIYAATGVATSTLTLIAGGSSRVDLDVADRLLNFFSHKLGRRLVTQDLIEFTPDTDAPAPTVKETEKESVVAID